MKPVLVFTVITSVVPLEIEGTICGQTFYYRGRHEKWAIYDHLVSYGNDRMCLGRGNCTDGVEGNLDFAISRILAVFMPTIDRMRFPDDD